MSSPQVRFNCPDEVDEPGDVIAEGLDEVLDIVDVFVECVLFEFDDPE